MSDHIRLHGEMQRLADETGEAVFIDAAAKLRGMAAEQRLRNSRRPPNGISLPGSGSSGVPFAPRPPKKGPIFTRTPPAPAGGRTRSR